MTACSPLPAGLQDRPGGPAESNPASPRRLIYLATSRADRSDFGSVFDRANPALHVERRTISTVAPQALYLMNHPWIMEQARGLARRADVVAETDPARADRDPPPPDLRPAGDRRRDGAGTRLPRLRAQGNGPRGRLGPLRTSTPSDQRIPLRGLMSHSNAGDTPAALRSTQPPRTAMRPSSPAGSSGLNRRQMLGTVANGFGLLGLAGLLTEAQAERPATTRPTRWPPSRAPRGQGQARDLHLPERRSIARRPARPQASADRRSRQAAPVRKAQAGADHHREPHGVPLPVRPARPVRHRRQRAPAQPRPPASTTSA